MDSTLHRYPTQILFPKHCHHMCLSQGTGTKKLTFVDTVSKFDCFCAVTFCQTASVIEVFWIPLYTGTPHVFCLPNTVIACVFVSQNPLNFTFIHTDSTCQWSYALNFRQTPAIIEISRAQVHTGTPHIICHTNTAIACVSVKVWAVKNRSNSRLYTRTRHVSGFMLSTSAKLRQS